MNTIPPHRRGDQVAADAQLTGQRVAALADLGDDAGLCIDDVALDGDTNHEAGERDRGARRGPPLLADQPAFTNDEAETVACADGAAAANGGASRSMRRWCSG